MSKLTCLALVLGLAAPVSAQELEWHDGVLGSQLVYDLHVGPGQIWILGISTNEGPTPLSVVDPADPRNLFLGLDLLKFWRSGFASPTGDATAIFGLPPDVSAVGLKVHAQALTLPGTATLIDELSNTVALRLQMPGTSVATVGKRPLSGVGHTQTPLPSGRVLLAGGHGASGEVLGVNELFWPQGQVFVQSPALASPRVDHTASPLSDGRVLLAGGRTATGATASCRAIDPVTLTDVPLAPLPEPRSRHTATALADGRLLVVGGVAVDDPDDVLATLLSGITSTAIYDPAIDAWSAGPSLPTGLIGHSAVLLPTGKVLVTGGYELTSLFGFPVKALTKRAWRIDPATGGLAQAASLPQAIAHHASIVPSWDGRALVIGGERIDPFFLPVYVAQVRRYDEGSDAWTTLAPLTKPRGHHAAVEAAGRIVVVGGIRALDSMLLLETAEATAEASATDLSGWGPAIPLEAPRHRARATAVDDGLRVLVTGGPLDAAPAPTAELVMP